MTTIINSLKSITGLVLGSALLLSGCASTGSITPQYVPPSTYQNYNCTSLSQEYNRIASYVRQAQGNTSTIAATGIGVGISAGRWGISPNVNVGLGKNSNKQAQEAKLSRLYGERDAVIQAGRMQQCKFVANLKVYGE